MQVDKVFKNAADQKKVDVIIYYDKRDAKKDIIWIIQVHINIYRNFKRFISKQDAQSKFHCA